MKICPLGIEYKFSESMIVKTENNISDTFYTSKFGKLSFLDTRFPLKKIAYFKESNSFLVLNNRFGIVTQTALDKIGLFESIFVTYSSDGLIWVFDRASNRLLKINENNDIKFQIENPFIFQNKMFYPSFYFDLKTKMIALDTLFGIFVLDSYGNLLDTYSTSNITNIFEVQGLIFLVKEHCLYQYDIEYNELKKVKTNADLTKMKNILYANGKFYGFDGIEKQIIEMIINP